MNAFTGEGFCDWNNSKARIESLKNSDFHKTNVSHSKARAVVQGRVDERLIKQLDEEVLYWKKIIYCVIAIIKSLAIRGLPFRGHSEQIGDPHNGNFLEKEWPGVINALKFIAQNRDEKPTTRSEATGLQRKLQHLETAILVIVWNVILDHFNAASKKLQDSQADLSSVVQIYGSLALFLQDMRDKHFSEYEQKTKVLAGVQVYYRYDTSRKKTQKIQADESRVNERILSSGESSFSTLKRVKTYLRANMGQDRLNALALLSIEAQLVQEMDYDDKIDVFTRMKARKKTFTNRAIHY
ncbi:hypothetical protein EVAR_19664_1 [Eumeta japonica]|uniref:Uncharacterized protein n=1 Tax=Eumeta variegata TaxID=151549 RepID=A0A4C1V3I3_EUMVA|nr:hypothetical protein EVAR_19664_1 [Eumeta japonica]